VWWTEILDEPDASLLQYHDAAYQRHKQLTLDIMQQAGDSCLVSMNWNCSSVDALASMRGTQNLLADMIEEPDFVHEALDKPLLSGKKHSLNCVNSSGKRTSAVPAWIG